MRSEERETRSTVDLSTNEELLQAKRTPALTSETSGRCSFRTRPIPDSDSILAEYYSAACPGGQARNPFGVGTVQDGSVHGLADQAAEGMFQGFQNCGADPTSAHLGNHEADEHKLRFTNKADKLVQSGCVAHWKENDVADL